MNKLAAQTGLLNEMNDNQIDFLSTIQPLNIEARYPEYKEKLLKGLTLERCRALIQETENLSQWIREKL